MIRMKLEGRGCHMGISDKIKKNLSKKFSGNLELNKEVLRWKKSLLEVNRHLGGGAKKE
ncbi:MAG: hypothetical protein Q4C66_03365 [Lachnospiraceae bacterium]|nr:hypothetical protein [Lachnospiraceae bacterium]